eukprot:GHVU01189443.1.p1 GENE.GHVU01189443.1~~GHVU01189443.1.p1  ORF type:complete len:136 (+),score=1.58 GHVU01189443.1:108-515(+)
MGAGVGLYVRACDRCGCGGMGVCGLVITPTELTQEEGWRWDSGLPIEKDTPTICRVSCASPSPPSPPAPSHPSRTDSRYPECHFRYIGSEGNPPAGQLKYSIHAHQRVQSLKRPKGSNRRDRQRYRREEAGTAVD